MAYLQKKHSNEKLTGSFYTPAFLVSKVLDDAGFSGQIVLGKKVIDPSCGDGAFLVEVVRRIISASPKHLIASNLSFVEGWDINEDAVTLCKHNLDNLLPYGVEVEWRVTVRDALTVTQVEYYDFIVGNPPYVRVKHLPEVTRNLIRERYSFCAKGSYDLFIAFFQLALRLATTKAIIAFVTPNSYLYSSTAKTLRISLYRKGYVRKITNFKSLKVFRDASTYVAITLLEKYASTEPFYYEEVDTLETSRLMRVPQKDLWQKVWSLGAVSSVYTSDMVRLGDICKIHTALCTSANQVYILKIVSNDLDLPTLSCKTSCGKLIDIEREAVKFIRKVSTLKHSNEQITECVIFPYVLVGSIYKIIDEDTLKVTQPSAYTYLLGKKEELLKRNSGKVVADAWYAFGRHQGLETGFGEKIVFSPMNKSPKFIHLEDDGSTFYSGYGIKYEGDIPKLLSLLNSEEMAQYIQTSSRDFGGGWKGYSKTVVADFKIARTSL